MSDKKWQSFFAGGLAATVSSVSVCPIEVIKTRLQSSLYLTATANSVLKTYPRNGFVARYARQFVKPIRVIKNMAHEIKTTEGFRGFFRGLTPMLCGAIPARGVFFLTYTWTQDTVASRIYPELDGEVIQFGRMGVCAGLASATQITCTNPIWLVKTRLQLENGTTSAREVIRDIWYTSGFRGFYKGVSTSYLGIIESVLYYPLYATLRSYFGLSYGDERTYMQELIVTAKAVLVAKPVLCFFVYPHEVLRTRLRQKGNKYRRLFPSIRTIYVEEGFPAFYRGIAAHLIRQVPASVITLAVFELTSIAMDRNGSDS